MPGFTFFNRYMDPVDRKPKKDPIQNIFDTRLEIIGDYWVLTCKRKVNPQDDQDCDSSKTSCEVVGYPECFPIDENDEPGPVDSPEVPSNQTVPEPEPTGIKLSKYESYSLRKVICLYREG